MKSILVSQRIDIISDRNEIRDSLDQKLIEFILQSGYFPIPFPNCIIQNQNKQQIDVKEKIKSFLVRMEPSGLVLSGGNNLGQFEARDNTESFLFNFFSKKNLPILGICRGMQFLSYKQGCNLVKVEGHVGTRHKLKGEICHEVNSFHQFALTQTPEEYITIAKSEDETIKAIKHKSKNLEGWMWHPERENPFSIHDIERFKILFK